MTDIAAAIGIHQLARAEEMRRKRERIAATYRDAFSGWKRSSCPQRIVIGSIPGICSRSGCDWRD